MQVERLLRVVLLQAALKTWLRISSVQPHAQQGTVNTFQFILSPTFSVLREAFPHPTIFSYQELFLYKHVSYKRKRAESSSAVTLYLAPKQYLQQLLFVELMECESEVIQSCPTVWDSMDCSPPGSFIHGLCQARGLEWGAISFSRGSSGPRDQTQVSCVVNRCFTV